MSDELAGWISAKINGISLTNKQISCNLVDPNQILWPLACLRELGQLAKNTMMRYKWIVCTKFINSISLAMIYCQLQNRSPPCMSLQWYIYIDDEHFGRTHIDRLPAIDRQTLRDNTIYKIQTICLFGEFAFLVGSLMGWPFCTHHRHNTNYLRTSNFNKATINFSVAKIL